MNATHRPDKERNSPEVSMHRSLRGLSRLLFCLSFGLAVFRSYSAAVPVTELEPSSSVLTTKGTLSYEVQRAGGLQLRYSFTAVSSDCLWTIRLTPVGVSNPPSPVVVRVLSNDTNGNYYDKTILDLNRIQHSGQERRLVSARGAVTNLLRISHSTYPTSAENFAGHIWLAFCSRCYFSDRTKVTLDRLLSTNPTLVRDPTKQAVAMVTYHGPLGSFPSQIEFPGVISKEAFPHFKGVVPDFLKPGSRFTEYSLSVNSWFEGLATPVPRRIVVDQFGPSETSRPQIVLLSKVTIETEEATFGHSVAELGVGVNALTYVQDDRIKDEMGKSTNYVTARRLAKP